MPKAGLVHNLRWILGYFTKSAVGQGSGSGHPAHLAWEVTGAEGAVVWDLNTGIYPTGMTSGWNKFGEVTHPAEGYPIAVHSRWPGREEAVKNCDCMYVPGECYGYSRGSLAGKELLKVLADQGSEAVFAELEKIYTEELASSATWEI